MNDNFIQISKNIVPSSTCNNAIKIIDTCIASGFENMNTHDNDPERNDTALFADLKDKQCPFASVTKEINSILRQEFVKYNNRYTITKLPSKAVIVPTFKYQKSGPGQGFTEWHTEQGPLGKTRFAVWMLYLNNVVSGGNTSWLHQECSVKPTQGTFVIWPASYTHMHRAEPDLQENKYIATGWFEYPSD